MILYEGLPTAVEAQLAASPGERAEEDVWHESALAQSGAGGREPFEWQDCVLARPGLGIAFVPEAAQRPWSPLAERVRASFDPKRILV